MEKSKVPPVATYTKKSVKISGPLSEKDKSYSILVKEGHLNYEREVPISKFQDDTNQRDLDSEFDTLYEITYSY